MSEKVTLGGERLGTGSKMKQDLGYNYGMNSFNQGRKWWSTCAPGLLYPCFKEIGTNHGTFDIDVASLVRTLPTKGPLFGSFKMQVDFFNVPFRLYQGILHNNPTDIGMHMNEVYLPALVYRTTDGAEAPMVEGSTEDDRQISTNSLLKYLGLSGAGHQANYKNQISNIGRKFQCVPELGYYDIFKNYYSNKQEEKAFVVTPGAVTDIGIKIEEFKLVQSLNNGVDQWTTFKNIEPETDTEQKTITGYNSTSNLWGFNVRNNYIYLTFNQNHSKNTTQKQEILEKVEITLYVGTEAETSFTLANLITNYNALQTWGINEKGNTTLVIYINSNKWLEMLAETSSTYDGEKTEMSVYISTITSIVYTASIQLTPFKLKNIDKMRAKLLGNCELGDQVLLDANEQDAKDVWGYNSGVDQTGLPYCANLQVTNEGISWSAFNQVGLVTKTYQSDMFNNWLDNSLVDMIAQRTKIDTTSGGFTPDTLILQEKIYKYLNRILVSGGTYYDWQEATYGEGVARMCEIPMYIGGMSTEIKFEEVIANNESKIDNKYQALGSLAGKGTQTQQKGGQNIHVRMDEPGYIIGICSITPRISFYQGNDWDRTELVTMDDLHKPELDGIGFQDLMVENMCWWNTVLTPGGTTVVHRDAVGKQTAWLHYQTAVDKVFGDFAKSDGYSFMVLSRQYEHDDVYGVKDMTTYIDPAKYNYAFAYQDLAAQNFWVELAIQCTSRRKMGAQQLPTL